LEPVSKWAVIGPERQLRLPNNAVPGKSTDLIRLFIRLKPMLSSAARPAGGIARSCYIMRKLFE